MQAIMQLVALLGSCVTGTLLRRRPVLCARVDALLRAALVLFLVSLALDGLAVRRSSNVTGDY